MLKLREEPSEPEHVASIHNDGSIAVFELTRGCTEDDCFTRGLIYWLGTVSYIRGYRNPMLFGQINIQSSGMAIGEENYLTSRIIRESYTKNEPDCWICIDVGRTRAITPTYIAIRHGSPHIGKDILN